MDDFLWLDQIQARDRPLVGEKAFYLSQLGQKGFPAILGFVIKAPALRQFISSIQWLDPLFADLPNSYLHLDVDNPRQLQLVAQRIRREIAAAVLPEEWTASLESISADLPAPALILRPSLALPSQKDTSFRVSGLLESHVCSLSPEAIENAVKQVWAELFRARSLLYWKRIGIQLQDINLAVLVQPLQNSLAAGSLRTLATAHSSDIWEIQATKGLGIAIVRGDAIPDYYQVQAESGSIITQRLGVKTLAYNLAAPSGSEFHPAETAFDRTSGSPLQIYLLSEEQQQDYALEEKHLKELIDLGKQLRREMGPNFNFEWTLVAEESQSSTPKLYVTQIQTFEHQTREVGNWGSKKTEIHLPPATNPESKMFRGLGASGGRARAVAQVIVDYNPNLENSLNGKILVLKILRPDWLPLIKNAAGIVAEQGGMTCHAAIIARELGIPAVVGVKSATQSIQTGEFLQVDGDRGEIYSGSENELDTGESSESSTKNYQFIPNSSLPMATQLMVNLSQPSTIKRAASLPVDGVGLLRSELMFLEVLGGQHPTRWLNVGRRQELVDRLTEAVCEFAGAFAPRPVFYRSLDWRSHEFQRVFAESVPELNPMLGWRGTFSYMQDPTLFDLELEVLYKVYQSGYTNIRLILPFVRTIEEFSFCRRRVEQVGLLYSSQFQLWIMAEVPSILFLLPDYVKAGCMGISIGTNDLSQLLLGVDRDRAEMATAFDERNPAVMRAIALLIQMAKEAGIPCSICGQAPAQYPELIDRLVEWGITSISVSLDAVEHTHNAILRAEQRLVLSAARKLLANSEFGAGDKQK